MHSIALVAFVASLTSVNTQQTARAPSTTSATSASTNAAMSASPNSRTAQTAAELRDKALKGESVAWDLLTSLTTDVGPRPAGSPAMTRAKEWALHTLTSLGFKNVHAEEFVKQNAWLRGPESASMTAPYALPLAMIGLGNSPATPAGGIEADVVAFASLEALSAAPAGSLAGKIALVNQPMARTQNGEGYGAAVRVRGGGPTVAASKGAIGFLTRSIATGDGRAPHTGATSPATKIPAAALGVADADLLTRLAAKGVVRVKMQMQPTVIAQAPAWNIVGEIPGKDAGAKDGGDVIVIGGHLDSWDPGEGAVDDGAGVAVTVAAAKLVGERTVRPKRTIRVVLFGSEETGGSNDAYAKAHAAELAHIALCAESDSGAGRIYRFQLPAGSATDPALAGLASTLAPLRVFIANDPPKFAGSDLEELEKEGVPVVEFGVDASHYFDVHHSADDTLDKVDRADLEEQVAAWASFLWFAADSNADFRHPPAPPETAAK